MDNKCKYNNQWILEVTRKEWIIEVKSEKRWIKEIKRENGVLMRRTSAGVSGRG